LLKSEKTKEAKKEVQYIQMRSEDSSGHLLCTIPDLGTFVIHVPSTTNLKDRMARWKVVSVMGKKRLVQKAGIQDADRQVTWEQG
jgi:hypothetical protein